ncbi:hypothetical protein DOY81_004871 [Sarcophaga bullata]|nr:hypothetical protein DOY81_004871 [Sarcophaga bullata]
MMYRSLCYLIILIVVLFASIETLQKAKDNGDIYMVDEDKFIKEIRKQMQTESILNSDYNENLSTTTTIPSDRVNFDEIISICNSSFSIPMHYYKVFNTTATLPDLVDKTGMCFIRCLFEKSGFIENWKLNAKKIRENIWPAMGDTMEVCEKQGSNETNACVRAFAMANCLKIRSLVDARNNPI